MDCPLVQLARNQKIRKQFEEAGMVAIPLTEWIRFFETLAFMHRDGGKREIYCAIVGGHMVFSKARFERKAEPKPEQIELFDWGRNPNDEPSNDREAPAVVADAHNQSGSIPRQCD